MWLRDEPRLGCSSDHDSEGLRELLEYNQHKSIG